ncbi:hypothetical protein N0V90_008852 [Kalmusia sp. IMI 367209]|nr:hypothetical protein N0V90_008852 [Kalmusia sp. IMI 367209]
MFAKISILAIVAATTLTSALPATEILTDVPSNITEKRQEEWNNWTLELYTSGCDGDYDSMFSGHDDQQFPCTGGAEGGFHNVKMVNMAATGHKVLLYSDLACTNQVGEVKRDGTCYSAPTDTVIEGYAIVPL